ncbi:MAG: hypothetical protein M0R03_17535 [Novosphingobium sp.]|nr:hypothetical protein [Novosphingobium sp.]
MNRTNFLKSNAFGGSIELNHIAEVRRKVSQRWDSLGLTEGLEGNIKENVATLFENQAKLLLSEATSADSSGSFETVVFPLVRRVFSRLLANDIVSVQAMNLPIGRLFFMLPVTSEREWENLDENDNVQDGSIGRHTGLMGYERTGRYQKNSVTEEYGKKVNRFHLPDEVITATTASGTPISQFPMDTYEELADGALGAKNNPKVTSFMKKTLYDLFYDDRLYDNSKGRINIKVAQTAKPMAFDKNGNLVEVTDTTTLPTNSLDGTIRNVILEVTGFCSYNPGKLTGPDGNEMDTEEFLASLKVFLGATGIASVDGTSVFNAYEALNYRLVTQRYGHGIVEYDSPCDANGKMYLEIDLTKPVIEQGATIDGYIGAALDSVTPILGVDGAINIAWSQYDSLEFETEMGEVSFQLSSVTVDVTSRKLRATWSPEMAQDVNAFQNIDAEAELTALLSEQISAEIDREILRDLRNGAPWKLKWDVNGWRRQAAFSTNYTQKDWNQELLTAINKISAQIHKATLRGGANFIVVSSEVSALFDNLEYFHVSDASAESDTYNMGIERIGSLSSRYQCFRDPYSPAHSIIIGHKGSSLLDTGYIYAPYIPLQLTPTLTNVFNMVPVKGICTRYAKKMVNNRYYGNIHVDGLTTFSTNEFR